MRSVAAVAVLIFVGAFNAAWAVEGMVAMRSPHSASETMNRFESAVQKLGLKVFARVDHAAGAKSIGRDLRPTEVLIFGNPQGGTALMECAQSVGIDLPLKALAWEDERGQVWLGYNDPAYLAKRHEVSGCKAFGAIDKALSELSAAAIAN